KRGDDPRQFALVVLGGAGPVHGAALAEEMGMAEVLVPEAPGVLAAFGLLAAAIEHHHARTLQARTDAADLSAVNGCLGELDAAGRARMREEGVPAGDVRVAYAADMRYVGQAYELEVPITAPVEPARVPEIVAAFHAAHERVYGYARAPRRRWREIRRCSRSCATGAARSPTRWSCRCSSARRRRSSKRAPPRRPRCSTSGGRPSRRPRRFRSISGPCSSRRSGSCARF